MKVLLYLMLFISIFSCKSNSPKPIIIEERPRFVEGESSQLFRKIATPVQSFQVNVSTDTLLTSQSGTVISIPEKAFVNKQGEIITENVTIDLVEALSLEDYIRNDLQTVSGDQLLESGGMIYIDVRAGEEPLALAENSSLQVELPTEKLAPGYQIFSGRRDSTGSISWEVENDTEEEMIPLPLEELDLEYYSAFRYSKEKYFLRREDSVKISDPKFENTYIATEEFEKRFRILHLNWAFWGDFYDGYYDDWGYRKVVKSIDGKDTIYRITYQGLDNLYFENVDRSLAYSDSLALEYLESSWEQDSIRASKDERFNKTNFEYWHVWPSYLRPYFKSLVEEKLGKPVPYDPRGVDMSHSNAKELLEQKGYTPEEANKQVWIHGRRNRIIQKRQEIKRIEKDREEGVSQVQKLYTRAFKVQKLGWVNLDRFFNDPKAKEVEFFVQTISDSLSYCQLSLLLPRRNIAINATPMGEGKYRFTKEAEAYRKLPIGENAIVLAMSTHKEKAYFAMKKIKIEEKQNLEMRLKESTWQEVEAKLANLNK